MRTLLRTFMTQKATQKLVQGANGRRMAQIGLLNQPQILLKLRHSLENRFN